VINNHGRAALPRKFYRRKTERVAIDLLGCIVHRRRGDVTQTARIVETEAYVGAHDLACHASKGVTPRTRVLYGPPGHAYVYLIYGMHWCLNAVTEPEGHGSAVLIRALEPLEHVQGNPSGPGRLTQVLGIDKTLNEADLTDSSGPLFISKPTRRRRVEIARGPRVGVDYSGEWAKAELRFWLMGNPWVSNMPKKMRKNTL
jgi:DNA-3-methyladenine glycosylase